MTAYALAVEMDGMLTGRTVSSFRRHHAGCFMLIDGGVPSCVQFFHNRREAEILFPDRPPAGLESSLPALGQVEGKRITSVRPLGLDRIILIGLEGNDQWGDPVTFTLRIDLAPGIKAVSLFQDEDDRLLGTCGGRKSRAPSGRNELPPQKRWSLLDMPPTCPPEFSAIVGTSRGGTGEEDGGRRTLEEIIAATFSGVDPTLASVLSAGGGEGGGLDAERLWAALYSTGASLAGLSFDWNIHDLPGTKKGGLCKLYPVRLAAGARPEKVAGVLEAIAARASEIVVPGIIEDLRREATRTTRREIRRARRLIEALDKDLSMAESSRENRHFGNLLSNSRHLMRRGMESISVPDYSTESKIEIPLDPSLSPDANIKSYFRKARKGEKGLLVIKDRRANAKKGLKILEERLAATERIDDIQTLFSLLPAAAGSRQGGDAVTDAAPRFRCYRLDDDHVIYVGRNDRENDELTHRFAAPSDLWFHAQGLPGSHVVLKGANRSTPRRFIEAAASVAAWFSKGRNSSTVAVIFTEKRYVRKVRKARPGTATCIREKTLFVTPLLPPTE